ncbi:flavin reductase family protein, partial [Enterobacter hormaechei]|uniref:flavin reductase family protein n=1 Tax=Enterobacter hormaechei TaxID=158836 RepID=UPI003CC601A9
STVDCIAPATVYRPTDSRAGARLYSRMQEGRPKAAVCKAVEQARRFLEPGPIVLVSTAWQGQRNLMTMGWHMVMGFSPSLVATYLWNENHSHALAVSSGECVINVP